MMNPEQEQQHPKKVPRTQTQSSSSSLGPKPCILNPKRATTNLNPKLSFSSTLALDPKPAILSPKPYALNPRL